MRRILKAGTSNSGFTLLELVLVLFVIALVAGTVFPRIVSFSGGDIKLTMRHLVRTVQVLMNRAQTTRQLYRLNYDLRNQEYWATVLGENGEFTRVDSTVVGRTALKSPIRLEDVVTLRQGRVIEGMAYTQFYPTGQTERTVFHLSGGGDKEYTLLLDPLTGRIKIRDGYVETQ